MWDTCYEGSFLQRLFHDQRSEPLRESPTHENTHLGWSRRVFAAGSALVIPPQPSGQRWLTIHLQNGTDSISLPQRTTQKPAALLSTFKLNTQAYSLSASSPGASHQGHQGIQWKKNSRVKLEEKEAVYVLLLSQALKGKGSTASHCNQQERIINKNSKTGWQWGAWPWTLLYWDKLPIRKRTLEKPWRMAIDVIG